jgi:hypothetical protein
MRKLRRPLAVLIGALVFLVLVAGSDALVGTAHALPHFLTLSPSSATVSPGASQTFQVQGASGCHATWTFVQNNSGATLHSSGSSGPSHGREIAASPTRSR